MTSSTILLYTLTQNTINCVWSNIVTIIEQSETMNLQESKNHSQTAFFGSTREIFKLPLKTYKKNFPTVIHNVYVFPNYWMYPKQK